MADLEKIQQVVSCFIDSANISDSMEARLPLYRAQDLKKHMEPEDFRQALKLSVIEGLRQDNGILVSNVLEVDASLAQDAEIQVQAKKYFDRAGAKGLEQDSELKQLFGL